jgi:hypothetical protein
LPTTEELTAAVARLAGCRVTEFSRTLNIAIVGFRGANAHVVHPDSADRWRATLFETCCSRSSSTVDRKVGNPVRGDDGTTAPIAP